MWESLSPWSGMVAQMVVEWSVLALFWVPGYVFFLWFPRLGITPRYNEMGEVRRSERLAVKKAVQVMRGQLGASFWMLKQFIDSPRFYAGLHGDFTSTRKYCFDLQAPGNYWFLKIENSRTTLREYFKWSSLTLYEAPPNRFSFSEHFDFLALAYETLPWRSGKRLLSGALEPGGSNS